MTPNNWAMICHLSGLTGYLGNGIASIVAPLVIWLVKKDTIPEVDLHAKEALNFNLSIGIYLLALWAIVAATFGLGVFVAIPLGMVILGVHIVCTIMAAVKASNGEFFRYPFTIRLVK